MKKLWIKVTPIPPEFNGNGYLWECSKCGKCISYWWNNPNGRVQECPECGAKEEQ